MLTLTLHANCSHVENGDVVTSYDTIIKITNQTDAWLTTKQYAVKLTKHALDDDEAGVFESLTLVPDSTYYVV